MPDSLLPIQGPASPRERDLDALLSGEVGYPTVVFGPVADALAALRAAPAPDELGGEAAARAAFRFFMLPATGPAGGAALPAPLHQGTGPGHGHPDGQASTVVLPMTPPAGPRHARPRPRSWPGRGQAVAAACGVAAAVIVGVAALAGAFSGPAGQQARAGHQPAVQASDTSSKHSTSSVLGTATTRPTPRPSGSGHAASPKALCYEYMKFFTHPESPADWSHEAALGKQLSSLAGGRLHVMSYCARQLGTGSYPDFRYGQGAPVPGGQPGWDGRGEFARPGSGRTGP